MTDYERYRGHAASGAHRPVIGNLGRAGKLNSRPAMVFIASGIALIAAIAIGAVITIFNLRDRALSGAETELRNLALVLAEQTDRSFQAVELVQKALIDRMQLLEIATSEDYERRMSGKDTHLLLKDIIRGLPQIDAVAMYGPKGQLINFSRFWPLPNINVTDRDYFKALTSNANLTSFVSEPARNRATGTWSIFIARRVSGPNGEFLGLVLVAMELRYFEEFYKKVSLGPDGNISLIRRDGILLARHPHIEASIGKSLASNPLFSRLISNANSRAVRLTSAVDGQDRLIAAYTLPNYPIVVAVGTTVTAALANWRIGALYMAGIASLLAIVVGGIVFLTARLIANRLRTKNMQFDAALNNMSQGLVMFDSAARLVVCNNRYREIYKLPPDLTKQGCTFLDILKYCFASGTHSSDPEKYARDLLATVANGQAESQENKTADGRTILVVNSPMAGGSWVATHEDITERKRAEDELHRTQTFLNTVVENVPQPIVVKRVPGVGDDPSKYPFSLVNRAAEELFEISRDKMIGKNAHDVYAKDHADFVVSQDIEALRTNGPIQVREHAVETSDHSTRIVTARKVVIRDGDGKPEYLLSLLEDVTERQRAAQRIAHLAHHDPLTDLPNRTAFNERLASVLDRAKMTHEHFAIVSIDFDRFKEINDLFGHAVGDALLLEVARRLQAAAGESFLARLGGDEFSLIVADGPQPSTASTLAGRLLAAVADKFEIEGLQLRIGLSIGVAVYPTDGTDAKSVMNNADAALYRAKAEARGSVRIFEPEMDTQLRARRALQNDLKLAIDRGELSLHYQPQMNMAGEPIGFEALVRWRCPKRGMVPPGMFIPIAEESNLIVSVGEWVLREACREAASWRQPFAIAVNVSPMQFHNGDLPGLVHSILLETGLAPARLELEITEGVLISDFSRAVSILRRLKSLGVQIALDDFGTGYSSLSYLHSFDFDRIKIDRAFIGDLEHNRHSMAIVRAVISLGRSLDIPVLAEGVETDGQHTFLVQEGCDAVQGYLMGRPKPIADYAKLVGRPAITRRNYTTTG